MQNRTYRYFKGDVQYPFGYGKTYTKFDLLKINFNLKERQLSCLIKNSGEFDCDVGGSDLYNLSQNKLRTSELNRLIKCKRRIYSKG